MKSLVRAASGRTAWRMLLLATLACLPAWPACAGVSAYLPLDLAPEFESDLERAMVLAGVPVLNRPLRVTTVLDSLPAVCERDRALCRRLRRALSPYLAAAALTHAGVSAAAAQRNALTQANRHGAPMDSAWQAYAGGLARFGEHALLSGGAVGYAGRVTPTGTMASLGGDRAQLDLGYRDHWWSPFRLGTMLISTEAPTLPSATLSNVEPLTRANLRYELFLARMSHSDRIAFRNGLISGYPELFGFHVEIEPAPGWALGASRLMQFGGGARPHSLGTLWRAFLNATRYDNTTEQLGVDQEFGNEQFGISSSLVLPLRMPMSLYIEYAAEDTFHAQNTRFGSSAVAAGFYLPQLGPNLRLRYEFFEWQNNWYVHHIYQDGMSNDGVVLGNWAAQWRRFGDGVGGQSHALELQWQGRHGREFDLQYRTAQNASYNGSYADQNYRRAHELALRLSRPWRALRVGVGVDGGRDEYGEHFGRLSAFADYGGPAAGAGYGAAARSGDDDQRGADAAGGLSPDAPDGPRRAARRAVEGFVDVGMFSSRLDYEQDAGELPPVKTPQGSVHLAFGVRRAFNAHDDLGTRIEFDNVRGRLFMALRAIDYRRRFGPNFAASLFFGVGRYDAVNPAYGWYGGAGIQWREIWRNWDLGLDARAGDHMVRNKRSGEPVILWPNAFYSITGASLYLSRRF